ncbi:MAG: malto-oligosyltrehalose trehalohydrolase [Isosphaeraceae bacterium]
MSIQESEQLIKVRDREGATAPRWRPTLGAWPEEGGARFRVWAPEAVSLQVVIEPPGATESRVEPLQRDSQGTFGRLVEGIQPGDRYRYLIDGRGPFPDPASRFQPEGVHGPSELLDPSRFSWTDDDRRVLTPDREIVYELHVGTFSPEGTFAGVTSRLPWLRDLGITAIELMPVAEFAGKRSWGYDGVGLFAPTHNYGRPEDLQRLVDVAHSLGLGVILDVVYNHFGPVGNYAPAFSPHYLSHTHSSDWAACVNLDGEGSGQVREFFIENACHWVHEYHIDGLRLDAIHALLDTSSRPFVAELVERVKASTAGRDVLIVAEDSRNLNVLLQPAREGGWGLDGVWADDFHHQSRRYLTGDDESFFRDYRGTLADLATTINQGWLYKGELSIHQKGPRGTDPSGLPPWAFWVCLQNHDQVGNRAMGDRLHHVVDPAAYRAATAVLLALPATPLLFMGQEWGTTSPFQYFTDHDEDLGQIVREGRRREFGHFRAFSDPEARERIPDPQAMQTFERSRLNWSEPGREPFGSILRLYQALLRIRKEEPALRWSELGDHQAIALDEESLLLRRDTEGCPSFWLAARLRSAGTIDLGSAAGGDAVGWETILTTEDPDFAPDPVPLEIDLTGVAPVVTFGRPGAVLLRRRPVGSALLKG